MSHNENEDDGGGTSPPPAAVDLISDAATKPSTYMPMGALRGGACADFVGLVSVVSHPLENVIADFRTHIAPSDNSDSALP
jgi:hypothetical protein